MFNGVGLTTPKGSGTNGYVQRNWASLPQTRIDFQKNRSFKTAPDIKVKKANAELLLHEQKRKVELDVMTLEAELRSAGMLEDDIKSTITRERRNMTEAVNEGSLRYDSELAKKDTHQRALDKEQELEKFEKAVRIDTSTHVHGEAFDQDLQQQLKLGRMSVRAEQEQRRLVAAQDAQKAQQKADKLRAKAEKTKEKAQKKLQKLKAKQHKRMMKDELTDSDDRKANKKKGAKEEHVELKRGRKEKKDMKATREESSSASKSRDTFSSYGSSSSNDQGEDDAAEGNGCKRKATTQRASPTHAKRSNSGSC